jgi:hypothetical protein
LRDAQQSDREYGSLVVHITSQNRNLGISALPDAGLQTLSQESSAKAWTPSQVQTAVREEGGSGIDGGFEDIVVGVAQAIETSMPIVTRRAVGLLQKMVVETLMLAF